MIHRHRPLRHRVERIQLKIGGLRFERRVIKRQRIEVFVYAFAQGLRRPPCVRTAALGSEAKFLQHFAIELDHHRVGEFSQLHFLRPFVIPLVPVAHPLMLFGHFVMEDAVVLRVHFPLIRIGFTNQRLAAVLAAPANEKALAGPRLGFEVDNEVLVAAELARAVGLGKRRKLHARCEFDYHLLKWPAFALGLDHRHTH